MELDPNSVHYIKSLSTILNADNTVDMLTPDSTGENTTVADFYDHNNVLFKQGLYHTGILGVPYQFNAFADPRYDGVTDGESASLEKSGIGRVYGENVFSLLPLVYFKVGVPKFMSDVNEDKKGIVKSMLAEGGKLNSKYLSYIAEMATSKVHSQSKLYDFDSYFSSRQGKSKNSYLGIVETLVNEFLLYVGHPDAGKWQALTYLGKSADQVAGNSTKNSNSAFEKIRKFFSNFGNIMKAVSGQDDFIAVVLQKGTSYTESISSSTGQTKIAEGLSQVNEMVSEVNFLLGKEYKKGAAGQENENKGIVDNIITTVGGVASNVAEGLGGKGARGVVERFANTIAGCGKAIMPEVWKDSTFTKSYNLNFKFSTPYGSLDAIAEDVFIPLFFLMAMAMPRNSSDITYKSPFIIKCYSPGWFNCDIGIVESISITREVEDGNRSRAVHRLPTSVSVSMVIKDLYPVMAIAPNNTIAFTNNTGIREYLQTMAGVDLYDPKIDEMIKNRFNYTVNKIKKLFSAQSISMFFTAPLAIPGKNVINALRNLALFQ